MELPQRPVAFEHCGTQCLGELQGPQHFGQRAAEQHAQQREHADDEGLILFGLVVSDGLGQQFHAARP